jgi:hypothetical protein
MLVFASVSEIFVSEVGRFRASTGKEAKVGRRGAHRDCWSWLISEPELLTAAVFLLAHEGFMVRVDGFTETAVGERAAASVGWANLDVDAQAGGASGAGLRLEQEPNSALDFPRLRRGPVGDFDGEQGALAEASGQVRKGLCAEEWSWGIDYAVVETRRGNGKTNLRQISGDVASRCGGIRRWWSRGRRILEIAPCLPQAVSRTRLFDKLRMTRWGSGDLPRSRARPATVSFKPL